MGQLDGKVAIVIGASSPKGLGEYIARLYAKEGAKVVCTGRKLDSVTALAEEIGGSAFACDITQEDSIIACVNHAVETYGKLDIAVNSAGILGSESFADTKWETLQKFAVAHFIGPTMFIKYCALAMAKSGGGSIMTMSSLTAEKEGSGTMAYAATKAATDKAVRQAANEFGPLNVRVNSISPGLTKTPMTEQLFAVPPLLEAFKKETPLGRMPTVDEVAFTALYLANDLCSATGDFFRVSGGAHLRRLPLPQEMGM